MDKQSLQKLFEFINHTFACLSLICSFFVILIINRNKKAFASVNNQFVIQLLYSEIINNLTQLSSILLDSIGTRQARYDERMRICYLQIFAGLFANFYCLSSTLLLSFHLYDLFLKQGKFLSSQKNVRLCKYVSFYGCLFVSYIIFIFQMNYYQNYQSTRTRIRTISCWVSRVLDWVTCSIFIILIAFTCVFCFKCYMFIRNFSKDLLQDSEVEVNKNKQLQLNRIKSMQKRLIGYPLVNIVVFIFLLIHRFLVYIGLSDKQNAIDNFEGLVTSFILYSIPTCIRGMLYTFVYFVCQEMFRNELKKFFCCEKKVNNELLTEMEVHSNDFANDAQGNINNTHSQNHMLYNDDDDDEDEDD